jgi:hypothetical protein
LSRIHSWNSALGNELAAMTGGFYGPLAGSDGVAVALLALMIVAA